MHATLTCAQCHTNGNYTQYPVDCYSCHKADFTETTNPNHVASGFPTDCSICHTTTSGLEPTFDHSKTAFPLDRRAYHLACAQCHANNNYTTLPTDCYCCHTTDYKATNNPKPCRRWVPDHCHSAIPPTSWAGAVFDHSKTPFPLTGAQYTVACACATSTTCTRARRPIATPATRRTTTAPQSQPHGSGISDHLRYCHTTTSWAGATFNHTWFPTNHGGANGVCATCHTNSADYSVFTCTNCHAKAETDQRHSGINGYVYNSVNCYACHKNGGGG